MSIYSQIEAINNEYKLMLPGDTIIVALSGGIDSMVLLHVLMDLREKFQIQLKAAHINHHIRIPDADRDEQFVRELCTRYQIPLYFKKLKGFNLHSSEEILRNARYEFFDSILDKNSTEKLATGHHLSDQMETVIMRLMRGSSVRGLQGIPVKRDRYIRPLMNLTRHEIEMYATKHHIEYRKDFTNNSLDKTRNRIRHQIVPIMSEIFGEKMYRDFKHSQTEIELFNKSFNQLSETFFKQIIKEEDDYLVISRKEWQNLNPLVQRYLIQYCVYQLCHVNSLFTAGFVREIDRFIRQGHVGSEFLIKNKVILIKNRQNIVINLVRKSLYKVAYLSPESEIDFGRNKLRLQEVQSKCSDFSANQNLEFICGDRIAFPLKVRTWKSGDFFYPLGMKDRQKLSDFFINEKIERHQKEQIPVIENNGEIVWLAGLRLDDRYRINPNCKRVFRLEYIRD